MMVTVTNHDLNFAQTFKDDIMNLQTLHFDPAIIVISGAFCSLMWSDNQGNCCGKNSQ